MMPRRSCWDALEAILGGVGHAYEEAYDPGLENGQVRRED